MAGALTWTIRYDDEKLVRNSETSQWYACIYLSERSLKYLPELSLTDYRACATAIGTCATALGTCDASL